MYTLDDILPRVAWQGECAGRDALVLGLAVQLSQSRWSGRHAGQDLERLFAALDAGQYAFYFDRSGRAVGFVAWVMVMPQVSLALIREGEDAVLPSQWQGGDQVWILDLVARDGSLAYILGQLRDVHLKAVDRVKYFRHKGRRRIAKELAREFPISFFRRERQAGPRPDLTERADLLHGCARRFDKARMLGDFLLALRRGDPARRSPLWASTSRIGEMIALRQYRLYADGQQAAAGLLTWAWLPAAAIDSIAGHPLHRLHSSEWNEGELLCFCDAVAADGVRARIEADLCEALYPDETTVFVYQPPCDGMPARFQRIERARQAPLLRQWLSGAASGQ